jgi:hypothetical protein
VREGAPLSPDSSLSQEVLDIASAGPPEPVSALQCDISAPKRRSEEHVSAILPGHDRRDDRAIVAGETIRYERLFSIEFQPGIEDDGMVRSFTFV